MWKLFKNQLIDMKMVKRMAAGVAVCFLVIHICYLLLFNTYHVTPMVYFNIFSIVFYAVIIPVVYKEMFRVYTFGVYLEVVAHMSLAIYFTGWENGFQITLIGMCILAFFSEYVDRYMKTRYLHALPLSIVGMAAYIIMCIVSYKVPAPYSLPAEISFQMQLLMGVIVFVIMIFFLYLFVMLSSRYEDALSDKADHDQLTGLPNRYAVWDRLNALDRNPGLEGYWIAMLDIDDFKAVNDTYGHNAGDAFLKELAVLMKDYSSGISVSRWGGEEFLLLGRTDDGMNAAVELLDSLRTSVMDHDFIYGDLTLKATVTIGVSEYQKNIGFRDWIDLVDQKLYEGKKSGKNKIVI